MAYSLTDPDIKIDPKRVEASRERLQNLQAVEQSYNQQQAEASFKQRGVFGQAGSAAAGAGLDILDTFAYAANALSPQDSFVDRLTDDAIESIEKTRDRNPVFQQDPNLQGVGKWLYEGTRSAIHSMGVGSIGAGVGTAAGIAGGAVLGEGVGAVPGAIAGFVAGGAGAFGLAEYGKKMKEFEPFVEQGYIERADGTREKFTIDDARHMAMISGAAEGGFEFLGNAIETLTFGTGKVLTMPAKQAAKQALKNVFKGTWKDYLKRQAITSVTEIGSEMGTAAVQSWVGRETGLSNQTTWDAMTDVIGPTAVASVIFGGVGEGIVSLRRRNIEKNLTDPRKPLGYRLQAANEVFDHLYKFSPNVAKQWLRSSYSAISRGDAIDTGQEIDGPIDDYNPLDIVSKKDVWLGNLGRLIRGLEQQKQGIGWTQDVTGSERENINEKLALARQLYADLKRKYEEGLVLAKAAEFEQPENEPPPPDEGIPEDAITAGKFDDREAVGEYHELMRSEGRPAGSKADLMDRISSEVSRGKWDKEQATKFGREYGLSDEDIRTAINSPPREIKPPPIGQGVEPDQPEGPAVESGQAPEETIIEEDRVVGQEGGENLILRSNDKPFKTRKEADIARKLKRKRENLDTEIVPYDTGFALKPVERGLPEGTEAAREETVSNTLGEGFPVSPPSGEARSIEEEETFGEPQEASIRDYVDRDRIGEEEELLAEQKGMFYRRTDNKPFKNTREAAIDRAGYKQQGIETKVVSVKGGFALKRVDQGQGQGTERDQIQETAQPVDPSVIKGKTEGAPPAQAKSMRKGNSVKIRLATQKQPLGAHWAAMEADDLIPSHDAQTFAPHEKYPKNVQERQYQTDLEEQGKVVSHAQNLKTDLVLMISPDMVNGPPAVLPNGVVLGGNSRAMSIQRAYADGPHGKRYKAKLKEFAAQTGLDVNEIEKMNRPVLVRVVDNAPTDTQSLHRIASAMNKDFTQAMGQEAEAVSLGANVSNKTIERIGARLAEKDTTIRSLLDNPRQAKEILDMLVEDGVVLASEYNKYYSAKHKAMSKDGKALVENMLLGAVITEPDLLRYASGKLLKYIDISLAAIAKIKGRGGKWNISNDIQAGLQLAHLAKTEGEGKIENYLSQKSFVDQKEFSAKARRLAEIFLGDMKPTAFRTALNDYAGDALADDKNQAGMFDRIGPDESFWKHLGGGNENIEGQYKAKIQGLLDAEKPVQQNTGGLEDVFQQAADALPELVSLTREWSEKLGGSPLFRTNKETGEPGLKSKASAKRKLEKELHDEENDRYAHEELTDIAASTIEVQTNEDALRAFKTIVASDPRVVRVKNRYDKPAPGGYKDYFLNVRLSNGHIAELQINTKRMLYAKEKGLGHPIYEFVRLAIPFSKDLPEGEMKNWTIDLGKRFNAISETYYQRIDEGDEFLEPRLVESRIAVSSEIVEPLKKTLAHISVSDMSKNLPLDILKTFNSFLSNRYGTSSFSAKIQRLVSEAESGSSERGSGQSLAIKAARAGESFDDIETPPSTSNITTSDKKNKPDTRFSRKKQGESGGVLKEDVEAVLAPVFKEFPRLPINGVQVKQGFVNLPYELRKDPRVKSADSHGNIAGIFDEQQKIIHIIAENLDKPEDAVQVFLHELVGHYSLRQVLGKDFNAFLDRLYLAKSKEIKALAQRIGLDISTREGRREASEEWFAESVEGGNIETKWWDRFVEIFRKLMARLGIDTAPLTDNEIKAVTIQAVRHAKGELSSPMLDKFAGPGVPLIATHSLSLERLQQTNEMGAFPMPSIALTKDDTPIIDPVKGVRFGDIVLIAKKETVDPMANPENVVFDRDIWSIMFPENMVHRNLFIDKRTWNKIALKYRKYFKLANEDPWQQAPEITRHIQDWNNDRDLTQGFQGPYTSFAIRIAFLVDNGKTLDEIREALTESQMAGDRDKGVSVWRGYMEVQRYKALIQEVDPNGDKFPAWVKNTLLRDAEISHHYFVGNKIFYGDKASAVAQFMREPDRLVGYQGMPNVERAKALMASRFPTLTDAKKYGGGKLQTMESGGGAHVNIEAMIEEIIQELETKAKYKGGEFGFLGFVGNIPERELSNQDLQKVMSENKFPELPEELLNKIQFFIKSLRDLPFTYYEAKPRRVVRFEEFGAAMIPADQPEAIEILKKRGVPVTTYTGNDDFQDKFTETLDEHNLRFARRRKKADPNQLGLFDDIGKKEEPEDKRVPLSVETQKQQPGLRYAEAQRAIDPIIKNWKNKPTGGIHVVETIAGLPVNIRKRLESVIRKRMGQAGKRFAVKGLRDPKTGAVYIIASAHQNPKGVIETLLHEVVGHDGLQAVLGDDYNKFLNRLWWAKIRDIKEVGRKTGIDTTTVEGRRKAADEWFAQQVEHGNFEDSWWKRFVRMFNNALRKMGLEITLTDTDIAGLVAAAHGYFEKGDQVGRTKTKRGWIDLSVKDDSKPDVSHQITEKEPTDLSPEILTKDIDIAEIKGDEIALETNRIKMRSKAYQYAIDNLRGKSFINDDKRWNIQVFREGLRHFTRQIPTIQESQSLYALPELLKNAVWIQATHPEKTDKDLRTSHVFVGAIRIDNDLFRVKMIIKEALNGKKYYDHRLTEIKRPTPSYLSTGEKLSSHKVSHADLTTIKVSEILPDVKSLDKIRFSRRSFRQMPFGFGDDALAADEGQKQKRLRFGMYDKDVKKTTDSLRLGVNIDVVQSVRDLPNEYQRDVEAEINRGSHPRGFFDPQTETIWLIADHLEHDVDAVLATIHEGVGHYGLRKFLGKDIDRFLERLRLAKRREINKLADELGVDHYEATEEWFAEAVESGRLEQRWWDKFVAAVRQALRSMGVDSRWLDQLTDADLKAIAAEARRVAQGGKPKGKTENIITWNSRRYDLSNLTPTQRSRFRELKGWPDEKWDDIRAKSEGRWATRLNEFNRLLDRATPLNKNEDNTDDEQGMPDTLQLLENPFNLSRPRLNQIVQIHTAFNDIDDMASREGYTPTLDVGHPERMMLADYYDAYMASNGDPRRVRRLAFGNSPERRQEFAAAWNAIGREIELLGGGERYRKLWPQADELTDERFDLILDGILEAGPRFDNSDKRPLLPNPSLVPMSRLDQIVRDHTYRYNSFNELVDDKNYHFHPDTNHPERMILADAYDNYMRLHGDSRRADRSPGSTPEGRRDFSGAWNAIENEMRSYDAYERYRQLWPEEDVLSLDDFDLGLPDLTPIGNPPAHSTDAHGVNRPAPPPTPRMTPRSITPDWVRNMTPEQRDEYKKAINILAEVWTKLADDENAFLLRNIKIPDKSLEDIARKMSGGEMTVEYEELYGPDTRRIKLVMYNHRLSTYGGIYIIKKTDDPSPVEDAKDLYISSLHTAGLGKYFYQVAFAWAANNDRIIWPDSTLTLINTFRRTENMLSSALRMGTTKHLYPHTDQEVQWMPGDDAFNIGSMAYRVSQTIERSIPELGKIWYDLRESKFKDRDTNQEVSRDDIKAIVDQARRDRDSAANQYGIGPSTAERGIVTKSVLEAFNRGRLGSRSGRLDRRRRLGRAPDAILYSRRRRPYEASHLKDDLRDTLATVRDYLPSRDRESKRGFLSNLFWSAEYWQDRIGKAIFEATQKREDRKNSIFNTTLNKIGDKIVDQTLKAMKFKGVGKGRRFTGFDLYDRDQENLPKDYREVWKHIDHMDVQEHHWDSRRTIDRARSEEISKTLDELFRRGYTLDADMVAERVEIDDRLKAFEYLEKNRPLPRYLKDKGYDDVESALELFGYDVGYRDELEKQGVKKEVIDAIDLFRQSRDRELELQRHEIAEIIHAYNRAEQEVPVLGQIDDFETGKKKNYTLKDAYREMGELRGFYAPRIRESGDWHVLSEKDGIKYRYGASSKLGARRLATKLQREGHTIQHSKDGKPYHEVEKLSESIYQQLTIGAVSQALDAAAGNVKNLDPETKAKMRMELIRSTSDLMKARGLRIPKIARTGRHGEVVRGYIEDPLARHLLASHRTAGGIAKGEAAMAMMEALNGIVRVYTREGDDWVLRSANGLELDRREMNDEDKKSNERTKRIVVQEGLNANKERQKFDTYLKYITEQLRNPDEADRWIGIGKSIASLKYLGFNPRSAMVNLTALPLTVPPAIHEYVLNGKGNIRSVMNEVRKSAGDYAKFMAGKQAKLTSDEKAFLDWLQEHGYDDPQLTREAMAGVQSAYGRAWSNTMSAAMWMFGKTEQLNRGATMLAAYRMAKTRQKNTGKTEEEIRALARFASDRAHGVYGSPSLPMWAMGQNPAAKIARMGFTFQKFGHNYLQMMIDLGWKKSNWKALAYGLVAPAVVGGLTSSALAAVAFGLAKGIMGAAGDDREPEKLFYDMIREQLGDTAERGARYGAIGVFPGIDLSSSLAVGMEAPRNLLDLTGPIGGIAQDLGTAKRFATTGRPLRAAEQAAPNVLRNMIRAYRELDGATTRSGHRIWDEEGKPYVPGGWETAKRVVGFGSSGRAAIGARQWESKKEIAGFGERRNRIYERYRAYLSRGAGNDSEFEDIMNDVRRYNNDVRNKGRTALIPIITRQSLRRQVRRMGKPTNRQMAMVQ